MRDHMSNLCFDLKIECFYKNMKAGVEGYSMKGKCMLEDTREKDSWSIQLSPRRQEESWNRKTASMLRS